MDKIKIIAVTGARSEYDLMYSIYRRLDLDSRFDFQLIVTGAHLSEKFGNTIKYIEEDGFRICTKIYNLIDSDKKIGRVLSLGNQISNMAHTISDQSPDIILVAGDREEAITVTMTGAYMDVAVAHFFGGDIAKDGNIDNSVRYAASKFAHIHFPTLEEHRKTLLKLGEEESRIFVVGNPALDRFVETPDITKDELFLKLDSELPKTNYFVLIQHSIITEVEKQREHIRITLDAILESRIPCFINYPNSDPGNFEIIEAYKEYCAKYPNNFNLFQNLDRLTYVNLLRNASAILGNSSSGLLEAPSLGLPAINIGSRQRGRVHGINVIFVDNNKVEILEAIQTVMYDEVFLHEVLKKKNPYGDGNSADKVVEALANIKIDTKLIHKNITY
jgi:GDP/UDP-N,N'-diacetylbacillosamine 2-epimerase (hydrolysing)